MPRWREVNVASGWWRERKAEGENCLEERSVGATLCKSISGGLGRWDMGY